MGRAELPRKNGSEGAFGRLHSCADLFRHDNIKVPPSAQAARGQGINLKGENMRFRTAISAVVLAGALAAATAAQAFDDSKYPDLSGQWVGVRIPGVGGQPAFDPHK